MLRSLRALFRRTSPVPASPETVTPIEKVPVAQLTVTLVTSAEPIVPSPLATEQDCEGPDGCVLTVIL